MSTFATLLTGNRALLLPEGEYALILPGGADGLPPVQHANVMLRVLEKKRVIVVNAYTLGTDGKLIKGQGVGWFSANKLRKGGRTVDVTNAMYGQRELQFTMQPGLQARLQVWMDELEEKGLLATKGTDKLSEKELVAGDPRVGSMHQENDGFCDTGYTGGSYGPPRQAWWVYLVNGFIDDDMGCGTIHECNLKTVLEHLKRYVRVMSSEERVELGED